MSIKHGVPVVVLMAAALLSASCGTRVDRSAAVSTANPSSGDSAPYASPAMQGAGPVDASDPLAEERSSGNTAPVSRAVVGSNPSHVAIPGRPKASGQAAASAAPKAPFPGAAKPVPMAAGEAGSPAAPGGSTPESAVGAPASPTRGDPKSPIVLGNVGAYSGPPATVTMTMLRATQAWVKHINQKGGINGHPVQLIVYDDASDPARHRAQVQDAIEVKRVMAFLGNLETMAGESSVDYITKQGVPVIGGSTNDEWFYESPVYFPQASTGRAAIFATLFGIAQQMVPAGKTKLGTLVCVEVQQCSDTETIFTQHGKAAGFEPVYRGRASIAQPDFTAECISARNAGTQFLFMMFEYNSQQRIAASCARQGYYPIFSNVATGAADKFKNDDNMRGGYVYASNVFPYFQSGTAATDEYREVMRRFGRAGDEGAASAQGWVSGKLFEKAAERMPEPPTRMGLFKGLWSIKEDTLGGLTQPLTFVENRPATPVACWYNIARSGEAWGSPDGFKLHCRPVPQ